MNLSITTIRHDINKQQLADIMTMYQTDENLIKRVDIERLARTGKSDVDIEENGVRISTMIEIIDNSEDNKLNTNRIPSKNVVNNTRNKRDENNCYDAHSDICSQLHPANILNPCNPISPLNPGLF